MTLELDLDLSADRPLVDGLNHVAISTTDLDRFVDFWAGTCGLAFHPERDGAPFRHGMLIVGTDTAIHVFELDEAITGAVARTPMFRRGRIDHFAISARDEHALRTVRDRLVDRGASDGTVTFFEGVPGFAGRGLLSVHIEDPDGGHSEICCVRTGVSFRDADLTPFAPPTNVPVPAPELAGHATGPR